MSFNYIGSKKSLINFIDDVVNKICKSGDTLLDGFAGTGIVGSTFANKYNLNVIANDLGYYSYIINYSLLCVSFTEELNGIISEINEKIQTPKIKKKYQLIANNYSPKGVDRRMFWTEDNAIKCDYARYIIDKKLKKKEITNEEHIFLVGSLMASMDKLANTTSVYGAFLKKFKKTALEQLIINPIHNNNINSSNKVFNKNINDDEITKIKYDVVYLDPPYNERQYSSNYHPLNYIAKYDNSIEIYGKTGLIKNYNKSNYCKKLDAIKNFNELIDNLNTKHIILSYNDEGIMNLDDIKKTLMKKGELILYKKLYKKYKSQENDNNKNVYELLFHCDTSKETSYNEVIVNKN